MRIGLVGAGRIGAFHAETPADLPEVAEVVVADAAPGRAQALATTAGLSYAESAEDLLGRGLYGFVVTSSTASHAALVRAAVGAGCPHVLREADCQHARGKHCPGPRGGGQRRARARLGANKGADFFTESGDVDTAAALLTLDDDTLVLVSATRYNGAGRDVRLEVLGSEGAVAVGDALEAFRVAEACELSRTTRSPVALADIESTP